LLLLGFLVERQMSAYELDKWIAGCNLQEMVRISSPAVYKNLIKLHEQGFLSAEVVKESEMPEKTVYSITDDGHRHFLALMDDVAQKQNKLHFEFNTVVLNLDKVDKDRGLQLLEEIGTQLEARQAYLESQAETYAFIPLEARGIISQLHLVNEALIRWLDDFTVQYRNK
jgi:DNA-binding PadR family transcriptional regulator